MPCLFVFIRDAYYSSTYSPQLGCARNRSAKFNGKSVSCKTTHPQSLFDSNLFTYIPFIHTVYVKLYMCCNIGTTGLK